MDGQKRLDLSSLIKATNSLNEALQIHEKDTANQLIQDAVIQRFEYTYELCAKMLRRYLKMTEPSAEVIEEMSFADLIRTSSERGLLLHPWEQWRTYREARNMTSHTYDKKKAQEVLKIIPHFLQEAQYLCIQLQEHAS